MERRAAGAQRSSRSSPRGLGRLVGEIWPIHEARSIFGFELDAIHHGRKIAFHDLPARSAGKWTERNDQLYAVADAKEWIRVHHAPPG
jgi:hypothetical protein